MPEKFDALYHRLVVESVIDPVAIKGCTETELSAIEAAHSIQLPRDYRSFLLAMGHDAGRLFLFDHYEFSYAVALNRTAEERESASEDGTLEELNALLGENGLIILHRLHEYHLYMHCDGSPDPSIRYFYSSTMESGFAYASTTAMLHAFANECERLKHW